MTQAEAPMSAAMVAVSFDVPDAVMLAFNATFEGQNQSGVIAELMREAMELAQRPQRGKEAVQRILARRRSAPEVTEIQIRAAREEVR